MAVAYKGDAVTVTMGFLRHDTVLLVTDSAVTHDGPALTEISSIGEVVAQAKQQAEELATKIIPLSTHAAATVSGVPRPARELLAGIRPHIHENNLGRIVESYASHLSTPGQFELVIARHQQGEPQLFHFGRGQPLRMVKEGIVVTGSLPKSERDQLASLGLIAGTQGWSPMAALMCVMGSLHWRAVNELPFEHGVGGVSIGALVDSTGFRWAPDHAVYHIPINIESKATRKPEPVLIDDAPFVPRFEHILVVGRGDIVAVASSITGTICPLAFGATTADVEGWIAQWEDDIRITLRERAVSYSIFVGLPQRNIVVLDHVAGGDQYFAADADLVALRDDLVRVLTRQVGSQEGQCLLLPPQPAFAETIASRGAPFTAADIREMCGYVLGTYYGPNADRANGERMLLALITHAPHDPMLEALLGALLEDQDLPEEVIKALLSALDRAPSLAGFVARIGNQLPRDPGLRVRLLESASSAAPGDADIMGDLAIARIIAGAPADIVRRTFEAALALQPGHENNTRQFRAWRDEIERET